jgi:hypothetical protein
MNQESGVAGVQELQNRGFERLAEFQVGICFQSWVFASEKIL